MLTKAMLLDLRSRLNQAIGIEQIELAKLLGAHDYVDLLIQEADKPDPPAEVPTEESADAPRS